MSADDPGCVKTHTAAKCRKNNSPGRHHASRVQYDLALSYAIPSRSFYARSKPRPKPDIDGTEIPQCSSLLAYQGVLPFGRSTGATTSETSRVNYATRRRGAQNTFATQST